ncbi:cytochrome P450 1A1-like [Paramacrobiotus metropolitanus]|uniref:cytochrome P450 1A1-like n=1 Tax=Paramacrobiotus metropolitanus TaxID=2943436 RepID=UPI00244598AE|nr:cytochrome P450 1A1-like [Paramacrobiotus metropolitanus]
MALIHILLFIVVILFLLYKVQPQYVARWLDKVRGRLPPGPFGLPIIGVTGISGQAPWETFTDWAGKYGSPLISFFNGSSFTVVISESDLVKTAMKNPAFDGRPANHASKEYFGRGIGFTEGDTWKTHRKLVVSSMRFLSGSGNPQMEFDNHMKKGAWNLVCSFRDASSREFDPAPFLTQAVADILSFLVFKNALTSDDPRFNAMINCCERVFSINPNTDVMNLFPFLQSLPSFQKKRAFFAQTHEELFSITKSVISTRKAELDKDKQILSDEAVDFTEALLKQQTAASTENAKFLTDVDVMMMTTELYMAGSQDTKNVLHWILFVLILFPEEQQRLHEYIVEVIGKSRAPSVFDKEDLPYVEAFILETQRFSSSMPFPLPHRTVVDTTLGGYLIPADTTVIINAFAVNNDRALWNDPEIFRPNRFMGKDGKLNQLISKTTGFGEGRRRCPGEQIARIVLIVFLTTLVQNIKLVHPEGYTLPPVTRTNGTSSQPPFFEISVNMRDVQH